MPPIASPYKVVLSFVFILKLVSSYKQFMQISDNKEYLQDASESTFTDVYLSKVIKLIHHQDPSNTLDSGISDNLN
jgi:hypothetical protein